MSAAVTPVEPKPAASVVLVRPSPPGAPEPLDAREPAVAARIERCRKALMAAEAPFGELLAREGWYCDLGGLRYLSHFITPRSSPIRFSARFFLCRAPSDQEPRLFTEETSEGFWTTRASATGASSRTR